MERGRFEALVIRAVKALPWRFRSRLENIDVVVQDWPALEQLAQAGLRSRWQLLGLYEGVPLTERGICYNLVPPDKITIFQRPIEARCRSGRKVEVEVGRVVRHEIAHHFGLDDNLLQKIEAEKVWRKKK